MSNKQFERLVSNLQGIMRCPHCSGSYDLTDIHYLGQMDAMTFLHMRCSACSTPVFASVALTNDQGEIRPADIATNQIGSLSNTPHDLSQANDGTESPRFTTKQLNQDIQSSAMSNEVDIPVEDISVNRILDAALTPVSYDDVLDIHLYIENFSGDFETAFGES